MIDFLKNGNILNSIKLGTNLEFLYSTLGDPTNIVGDKKHGYLYYGAYRYGYTNNIIDELAVEFKYLEKPLEFKNLEYKSSDISIFEDFIIKPNSKVHDFINLINHLKLNWVSKNNIDKDYMNVKIEGGPYLIFDLYNGTIDKISTTT